MILPGPTFSGYVAVQVPENASKIYTDDAVRQMFASAVIRNEVPVEEQLGLMPFKISELSSFKNVRTLAPGAALILSDGDEKTGFEVAPFMIIGLIGSTAASPDDRGRFAQQIATTIPGVRDGRITMSEPVRIDGQPGYETRIDAISGKDNTPVTIVQWLRFGAPDLDAHHRLFAARRLDQGLSALPRRARRHSAALERYPANGTGSRQENLTKDLDQRVWNAAAVDGFHRLVIAQQARNIWMRPQPFAPSPVRSSTRTTLGLMRLKSSISIARSRAA